MFWLHSQLAHISLCFGVVVQLFSTNFKAFHLISRRSLASAHTPKHSIQLTRTPVHYAVIDHFQSVLLLARTRRLPRCLHLVPFRVDRFAVCVPVRMFRHFHPDRNAVCVVISSNCVTYLQRTASLTHSMEWNMARRRAEKRQSPNKTPRRGRRKLELLSAAVFVGIVGVPCFVFGFE